MQPPRGFESLRSHRWSSRYSSYFLTLCTADRAVGLTSNPVAAAIRQQVDACAHDGHWRPRATVIMPDHTHLLIELTGALPLGRVVARLKTKTRSALIAAGLRWQGNYYEHRLRDGDEVGTVLQYIFLNPYRAGLVPTTEIYPHFWLHEDDARRFRPTLDDDRPFPEWLA
ncbi:REP-associated tyrosine transposase [Nibricoccus aquaticus]|uniref:REP-associated tyrosine transposase n=1 Tax=Nibricoccus aquaticus TaxID=2576891 RepID=UPI0015862956|nr:transposase [Nibricoccus aquaticus]